MNSIKNDIGEIVTAMGAPGSVERVKVEYPSLIKKLNKIYVEALAYGLYGRSIDKAIEVIRESGIKSPLETKNILSVTLYRNPPVYEN